MKQYLDDGSRFCGSKDLQEENEQLRNELEAVKGDRDYFQMIAQDYTPLQDELAKKKQELEIIRSQGGEGTANQSRITELEDELRASQHAKERDTKELDTELKNAREMARQMLVEAQEKSSRLEKENEEMKEEIAILKSDVDMENLTPEEKAIVRAALAKQAKIYRQREKDLRKRIMELEEEVAEPVDISAAIDEAVREVVKRASDIQTRLKAENAALKKRIMQLESDPEDDFENIEDVVKNSIEGADQDKQELLQEIEVMKGEMIVANSLAEKMRKCNQVDHDNYLEASVTIKQLTEQLDEKEQIICDLEKQAISEWKRSGALTGLVEKYAVLSGLSEEEVRYLLFECHSDDGDEVETLNESHYAYDARLRAVVHHTPEKEATVVKLTPQETVPTYLRTDMDKMSGKLFEYQRLIKKLTFENKNMKNALDQNGISVVGLDSFEKIELDRLYNQFWSDQSDLIEEITQLRRENVNLRDQIDHLPTEARLYRETVLRGKSMEQDDDVPVRFSSPEQLTGVGARLARTAVPEESELEKRNRELTRRLEETKKQLSDANAEFRKVCESLEHMDAAGSAQELTRTVKELTAMKEKLEAENRQKEAEIVEVRAAMAKKEEQLKEKEEAMLIARELAEKRKRDYEQAQANVQKKEEEIQALKADLAEKAAALKEREAAAAESSSSDSEDEKEVEELRAQLSAKEEELKALRSERDRATSDATSSQADLATKVRELEKENDELKAELAEKKQSIEQLEKELRDIKKETELTSSSLTIAEGVGEKNKKELEEVKKAKEELEAKVKELEGKVKELKKDLKKAKPKSGAVAAAVASDAAKSKELEAKEKELEEVKKAKEEAEQKEKELQQKSEEMAKEVEELKARLAEMEAQRKEQETKAAAELAAAKELADKAAAALAVQLAAKV